MTEIGNIGDNGTWLYNLAVLRGKEPEVTAPYQKVFGRKFNPSHVPAGSPEGGQFTSGSGGGAGISPGFGAAVDAKLAERKASMTDEAKYITSPTTEEGKLLQTGSLSGLKRLGDLEGTSESYTAQLATGLPNDPKTPGDESTQRVQVKPYSGLNQSEIYPEIPPGQDPQRERASWLVNQQLGLVDMPESVIRNAGIVPYSSSASGAVGTEDLGIAQVTKWEENAVQMCDVGRVPMLMEGVPKAMGDMAIFDYVTGNFDRHSGNLMLRDEGYPAGQRPIVAIDHGISFPDSPEFARDANNLSLRYGSRYNDGFLDGDQLQKLEDFYTKKDEINAKIVPLVGQEAVDGMWKRVDDVYNSGHIPSRPDFASGEGGQSYPSWKLEMQNRLGM